ncbi:hypothetical protein AX769_16575 [Frondihabitans sp. PAMC 28766]|uniref:dienelactone hydrolase family protein n=1 Tax=Frondihabitans sp. PAMC 28766 TaxID=1795630 RepID=UPI00078C2345|nr:hypothetical protein [Frondihabitans sp. PAMC 28766]AMM21452.1 hypothetical protein AX769_16575 [Frondihabitans sp. PAMC 28766]
MTDTRGSGLVADLLRLPNPRSIRPVTVQRRPLDPIGDIGLESVVLGSQDGDLIPCLYLTPATPPPWPRAMIAVHQHADRFDLGKSEPAGLRGDPALAFGLRLAEAGLPTLIPDLVGFEDRQRSQDDASTAERFDALWRIAEGSSLQAKHTSDLAVATSWLEDNVDGPIGIMGHSLGGQVALFALVFDSRLTVGVISCGIGTLASFRERQIPHNPAWFVPDLTRRGDIPAIAALMEDRRLFVSAGSDDPWFPIQGVHEVIDAFPPGVCEFRETASGHQLTQETIQASIAWLKRTL